MSLDFPLQVRSRNFKFFFPVPEGGKGPCFCDGVRIKDQWAKSGEIGLPPDRCFPFIARRREHSRRLLVGTEGLIWVG